MTDLEMTKLCAEAMEYTYETFNGTVYADCGPNAHLKICTDNCTRYYYNPLHDDAQAMALVKKLRISPKYKNGAWGIIEFFDVSENQGAFVDVSNPDLNRAVVECVAKMQTSKR